MTTLRRLNSTFSYVGRTSLQHNIHHTIKTCTRELALCAPTYSSAHDPRHPERGMSYCSSSAEHNLVDILPFAQRSLQTQAMQRHDDHADTMSHAHHVRTEGHFVGRVCASSVRGRPSGSPPKLAVVCGRRAPSVYRARRLAPISHSHSHSSAERGMLCGGDAGSEASWAKDMSLRCPDPGLCPILGCGRYVAQPESRVIGGL